MSKTQKHLLELGEILDSYPSTGAQDKLYKYITANSNLPGPRANLELAAAFEEIISSQTTADSSNDLWDLCSTMTGLSAEVAPVNDPSEFIPFCGTRGLGAIGAQLPEYRGKALFRLRALATDSRWRMREAVAMALQRLLSTGDMKVREELDRWIEAGGWLELRGAMAGISEPRLLEDEDFVEWALEAHKKVLGQILVSSDRKSEGFKTLRKALGYTLSLIVQAAPIAGFHFLEELVGKNNSDINWIIKQNLKKKRLAANYPREVDLLIQKVG